MIIVGTYISLGILLIAFIAAFFRLVKGPDLPDRVVAMDLLGLIVIGIIICLGIIKKNEIFLDTVLIITLIMFLGTIGISKYLIKRHGHD